jgi:hypothetical protein
VRGEADQARSDHETTKVAKSTLEAEFETKEQQLIDKQNELIAKAAEAELLKLEKEAQLEEAARKVQKAELEKNAALEEARILKLGVEELNTEKKNLEEKITKNESNIAELNKDLEKIKSEAQESLQNLELLQNEKATSVEGFQKTIEISREENGALQKLNGALQIQVHAQKGLVAVEDEKSKRNQAAIIMLYCYNLSKTYREIAGDIIQILYIAVMIKMNGYKNKEAEIETNIKKGFEFIKLNKFLRFDLDKGDPPEYIEHKPPDYDSVVQPDDSGRPTKPYVLSDKNTPITPINLNDALYCIDELLKIFSSHKSILTDKRAGGMKFIEFFIYRISKKLKLELEHTNSFDHLIKELNTFIEIAERVIKNEHIEGIKNTIKKISGKNVEPIQDGQGRSLIKSPVEPLRKLNTQLKTKKNKPSVNNKTERTYPGKRLVEQFRQRVIPPGTT